MGNLETLQTEKLQDEQASVPSLKDVIKELWNCRNELCLRCGKYENAHRGACDDCRYNFKNMEKYKR